jgi:hypothetical protein
MKAKRFSNASRGPCLMAYMEDGNQGGPPISEYLVCRHCTQKVKEEIEELKDTITELELNLTQWESKLQTAASGDD